MDKNDRQRQAFEAFKKAWEEYPSQDNEGYIPDRGGFKCGWFSALQWADSTPPPQEGDEEWIDSRVMELMGDGYNTESQGVERAVRKVMLREGIAHAHRAQNAEVERLKKEVEELKDIRDADTIRIDELRSLLERAKPRFKCDRDDGYGGCAFLNGPNLEVLRKANPKANFEKTPLCAGCEWLSDYEKLMGKKES